MKTNFAEVLRMHRSARLWRSFQSAAVGVRTILGMALIVTMPVHVAAQALDTTPPVLTAFDFTPKTIDTTAGAATVTVTFSGTDDLAGMYSFFVAINSPSGQHWQYAEAYCKPNCPPSGGFGFSQYGTEAGVWTVAYVSVEDAVGNRRTYFTADLTALGFPTELTALAGALDTTPPVLTAFDFTPKTIDTTAGSAAVTVTFSGADDLAGMYSFFVAINSPSGQHWQYADAYCRPDCPPSRDVGFSQYGTEAGVWTVAYVSVEDAVGNRRTYFTADLVALGFPTQLLSTHAQALDTTPPVLTAFDFTPKTIDTTAGSAAVTVTFSGTDDLAGMYSFFVAINSPSGQHWQYAEAYCKPNCPPSGGFGFSQYGTEAGVWTVAYVSVEDAVGNRRTYFTADLVALGFPTQLLSTGAQYNFTGFFQPVASLPTMNVAKAGSAIPVKWSLGGYQGMDICAAGYPASGPIPSDPTQVTEAIEETVTAGNSSLNYDAGAGQYVYVWKTQKAWAGTSRQLVIKLKDGTYHRANFKFTK